MASTVYNRKVPQFRPYEAGRFTKKGEGIFNPTTNATFRAKQDIITPGAVPTFPLSAGLAPYYEYLGPLKGQVLLNGQPVATNLTETLNNAGNYDIIKLNGSDVLTGNVVLKEGMHFDCCDYPLNFMGFTLTMPLKSVVLNPYVYNGQFASSFNGILDSVRAEGADPRIIGGYTQAQMVVADGNYLQIEGTSISNFGHTATNAREWTSGAGTITLRGSAKVTRRAKAVQTNVIDLSMGGTLADDSVTMQKLSPGVRAAIAAGGGGGGGLGTGKLYSLAAEGILSDANLALGSTTFGTDQTDAIQAVLDRALNGAICVLWDVKCSVSGLRLHSNTQIAALPGCGAILRDLSNVSLLRNANFRFATGIIDQNIAIRGGTWNGNNAGQPKKGTADGGPCSIIQWAGVRNVVVEDVILYTPKVYALAANTIENAVFQRGVVDVGANGAINMDGLHVDGNSHHCIIRDWQINTYDDGIGINADDQYLNPNIGDGDVVGFYPPSAGGPVSDVLIENIRFENSLFGIRILSGGSRVDNIIIRNITGTTKVYWLVIDNFYNQIASYLSQPGKGNIGTITIEDCDVRVVPGDTFGLIYAGIQVGANIERLLIKSLTRSAFPIDVYPSLYLHNSCLINQLFIDGYASSEVYTSDASTPHILNESATIKSLAIRNANVEREGPATDSPLYQQNAGSCENFQLNGVAIVNTNSIVNILGGTFGGIQAANISYLGPGAAFVSPAVVVPDIVLSNYYGNTILSDATKFTAKRGDGFGTASIVPLRAVAGTSKAADPNAPTGTAPVQANAFLVDTFYRANSLLTPTKPWTPFNNGKGQVVNSTGRFDIKPGVTGVVMEASTVHADWSIQASVTLSDNTDLVLLANVVDGFNYLALEVIHNGADVLSLFKCVDNTYPVLLNVPLTGLVTGNTYAVKLTKVGTTYTLFWQGMQVGQVLNATTGFETSKKFGLAQASGDGLVGVRNYSVA